MRSSSSGRRIVCSTFSAAGQNYVYDAYSNEIMELTREEGAILAQLRDHPSGEHSGRQATRGPRTDSASTARFLAECAAHDVLQSIPGRAVASPPSPEFITEYLSKRIQALVLGVTEDCNCRCKYCVFGGAYEGRRQHASASMSLETARQAVRFYLDRCAEAPDPLAFSFYGGEPLLQLDLIEGVVRHVNAQVTRPVGFHLTTNGICLNDRRVRRLLVTNEISILVSLDGPPERHDAWRRTKGGGETHAIVVSGLEKLRDEAPDYYSRKVSFNAVLAPPATIAETRAYFLRSDFFRASTQTLRMSYLEPTTSIDTGIESHWQAHDGAMALRQYVDARANDARIVDGLGDLFFQQHAEIAQRPMGPISATVQPRGFCVPGGRKLFVSPDGQLGICEKTGELIGIGTLTAGFDYGKVAEVLRQMHGLWSGSCSSCEAQRFCKACPAEMHSFGAWPDARSFRMQCAATRRNLPALLQSFVEACTRNPEYLRALEEAAIV